jgi:chromate transporter
MPSVARVGEIAAVFLRLGLTAFGGPAAHVALIERKLVDERRWLTREELVELRGAASQFAGAAAGLLLHH